MSVHSPVDVTPLSPRYIAQGVRLSDVQWDSDGQTLVWYEGRSDQGILVAARHADPPKDLTSELSIKARVGYGGGDFTVANGRVIFASNGRLYQQAVTGDAPRPITPAFGAYASPTVSPDGRWVAFIHSYEGEDALGIVDVEGRHWPRKLIAGEDFYMQPAWHPDGDKLAYITWNHPQMPWDGTELRIAYLKQVGKCLPNIRAVETLAGGLDTAIFQPTFSPDGRYLAYVSDEAGWGQIYLYDVGLGEHRRLTTACAEHARPAWVQGVRTLAWSWDSGVIFALRNERGRIGLWLYALDGTSEAMQHVMEFTGFESITASPTDDSLAFVASSSTIPHCVATLDTRSKKSPEIVFRSRSTKFGRHSFSTANSVAWTSFRGAQVHGLYYPPADLEASDLPPAVVLSHGGPTSQHTMVFYPEVQFFTTRGYAVLQVNYRGSTGYGREYMLKLRGGWGELDRQDIVSGADYLVENRLADPQQLVVMGSSAGGTTALLALINHPGLFQAGVCSYAVSNMFNLAYNTHKFEERYLETMIGALPESEEIYRERSALFHIDKIQDAIIVFQGTDDQVVPREQSDSIADALQKNAVPHEYHVFEGEGHGWRKTETIEAYYKAVEAFLRLHVLSR